MRQKKIVKFRTLNWLKDHYNCTINRSSVEFGVEDKILGIVSGMTHFFDGKEREVKLVNVNNQDHFFLLDFEDEGCWWFSPEHIEYIREPNSDIDKAFQEVMDSL